MSTSPVSYEQFANEGYYKKKKDDKKPDEWMCPKYPKVSNPEESLIRVKRRWVLKESASKWFLSKGFNLFSFQVRKLNLGKKSNS